MSANPVKNIYAQVPWMSSDPIKFIRFGGRDVTKPNKIIHFGAMDVSRPYKFICFGALDVTKTSKLYTLRWMSPNHINLYALVP